MEKSFNKRAEEHQLAWRDENIELKEDGSQNKKVRHHILPSEDWLIGLWDDIQDQLVNYIVTEQVHANIGKHNLKSSWTQCANTFFPFRQNDDMKARLVSFLNIELKLNVTAIDGVDLEYAGPGKLSPKNLLGEMSGKRGSGQTSPDVAIQFSCENGKCGIYLIENKYTEHHFYACSAAKKTLDRAHSALGLEPNPNPDRCKDVKQLISNPDSMCHQATWGRKYWEKLRVHLNEPAFGNIPYCPAMRDGYQIFRQQALAQGIADSGLFDHVITGIAYDKGNNELITCLKNIGINDFTKQWGDLFKTASEVRFHCFTHQDLVSHVTNSRSSYINRWGSYITKRYKF